MKLSCCAVFDSAIQAYNRPFFAPTSAAAVRSFTDECKRADPENPMYQHPDDFQLVQLFELDDNTGQVANNVPTILLRAKDVQK